MFSKLVYLLVATISFLCMSLCKDQLSSLKGVIDVADGILVYANFYPFPHHKLNSTPIESYTVYGERDCISACAESSQCRSLNFRSVPDANGKYLCQILDTDKFNLSESFNGSLDFHHHSFTAPCDLHPCKNGGTCYPVIGEYDFKCVCTSSFGGKRCAYEKRYKSCAELFTAGFTKDGVYQILSDQSEMIDVYCDQSSRGGGWTMVFKVVSGVSADIYQLWTSAESLNENNTKALNVTSSFKGHYKNRFVQNWPTARPKEARVALYSNNESKPVEILSLVFNATNSNNVNWFSRGRLTHSPWTDLFTEPLLTFALQGCCGRTFYITKSHGGCPQDFGWLLVSFNDCVYESRLPQTTVMYSNHTSYVNWNNYGNVGIADTLVVYIR